MKGKHVLLAGCGLGLVAVVSFAGCGTQKAEEQADAGDLGPSSTFAEGGGAGPACESTVTGTVFAPNGQLPLYNAIVYVPAKTPAPFAAGASCEPCGAVSGDPIVSALSDATGKFTLKNVPPGKDVPLVIQVGKWRRRITIPEVAVCKETVLTNPELTRLPRNQSEGDMPRIALTTGGCDKLGCMLPKIGIDASEFGLAEDGPSKAVHVYNGNPLGEGTPIGPGAPRSAVGFWNNVANLKKYDLILLSCECNESGPTTGPLFEATKDGTAFAAMTEYLKAGGRIFTTDFMYTWYKFSPDPLLAGAASIRGGAPHGDNPMTIDTSFPKGRALADWFETVTPGSGGQVTADYVFGNVTSVDPTKAREWARSGPAGTLRAGPRVFSVNVPVGAPANEQCGKGVHIDAHLNDGTVDQVDPTFPKACTTGLKPGEKLLAFFFFDLASCIQNEADAPVPPPVVK
jgi:hypothetical protein